MRGMLVDDHDTVRRLSNDIGLVQLRPGGAEREFAGMRRRRLRLDAGRGRGIRHERFPLRLEHAARQAHRPEGGRIGCLPKQAYLRRFGLRLSERKSCHRRRGAVTCARETVAQRADHQAANAGGITKAHFGLRRVNVDVDLFGFQLHEQRQHRMAVAREEVLISRAHHAGQHPVFHGPSVHEQVLHLRIAAVERWQACKTGETRAVAFRLDRNGVVAELPPHDRAEPRETASFVIALGRIPKDIAAIVFQREPDRRIGHRETLDHVGDGHGLGPLAAHEFQARRCGMEQIRHVQTRTRLASAGEGRRLRPFDPSGLGVYFRCRFTRSAADDPHPADRGNRRQGFAAKTHGVDVQEIDAAIDIGNEFRRSMPFQRQGKFVRRQAAAIILEGDPLQAAVLDRDGDVPGAGIERVFHKLLHRRCRAFDDFARRDAVDHLRRQPEDHGTGARRISHQPFIVAGRPAPVLRGCGWLSFARFAVKLHHRSSLKALPTCAFLFPPSCPFPFWPLAAAPMKRPRQRLLPRRPRR